MSAAESGAGEAGRIDDADVASGGEVNAVDAVDLPGRGAVVGLAVVFALLYGYELYEAVGNFIQTPIVYAASGLEEATPWGFMAAWVAVPPVLYAAALLLGRGRPLFARAILLVIGLATANALAMSLAEGAVLLLP